MSRTKQLTNKIKLYSVLSYNGTMDEAYKIDPAWKVSTWERELRRSKVILIIKRNTGNKGIKEYKYMPLCQVFNKSKELKTLHIKKQDKLI